MTNCNCHLKPKWWPWYDEVKAKMKTHKQIKCTDCGLWTIWVRK